ncbi:unnamed protein product [Blepharisma stoltei]|uniref:Uncharacterized protein n=1 Tax=Blepharisma stoltei TaxID=1481888 RepID=A0AAU9IP69_9CILI|nr:unnamed protein product [Blepharisma stoltei]
MNSEELKSFLHTFRDDLSKMVRFEINKALGKYVESPQDYIWDNVQINTLHEFFHIKRIRHIYDSTLLIDFTDYLRRLKLSKDAVYKKLQENDYFLPDLGFFTPNFLDELIVGSKTLLPKSKIKLIPSPDKSVLTSLAKSYVKKDKKLQMYMPSTPNMDPNYVINVVNTFYPLEESKKIIDFSNQIKESLKKMQANIPPLPEISFKWRPDELNVEAISLGVNKAINDDYYLLEKIKQQQEEHAVEEKANQMVLNLLETDYNEAQFAQLMA